MSLKRVTELIDKQNEASFPARNNWILKTLKGISRTIIIIYCFKIELHLKESISTQHLWAIIRWFRNNLASLRTEELNLAIVKHNCCVLVSILRALNPPALSGRLDQTNEYSTALLFSVKCCRVKDLLDKETNSLILSLMFYKAINLLN